MGSRKKRETWKRKRADEGRRRGRVGGAALVAHLSSRRVVSCRVASRRVNTRVRAYSYAYAYLRLRARIRRPPRRAAESANNLSGHLSLVQFQTSNLKFIRRCERATSFVGDTSGAASQPKQLVAYLLYTRMPTFWPIALAEALNGPP